jgi:hypothetical protein
MGDTNLLLPKPETGEVPHAAVRDDKGQPQNAVTWSSWHTIALLVIILLTLVIGLFVRTLDLRVKWILTLLLFVAFATVAGLGITGMLRGVLIDERNKVSLSRLQTALWTSLVVSALFTAALSNIVLMAQNPLAIKVPKELWLVMGISITSLVGSPLIKNSKTVKDPTPAEKQDTLKVVSKQEGIPEERLDTKGIIVVNNTPRDASFSDLFKGEETGNAAILDLGKVQMFYFTLILVTAYAVRLFYVFASNGQAITELPGLDESMIALLAISHAGYLVNKAVPHSQEEK